MNLDELSTLVNQSVDLTHSGVRDLNSHIKKSRHPFAEIITRQKWILCIFLAVTIIFIPHVLNRQKDELPSVLLYFILSVEALIALIALLQISSLEKQVGNIKYNLLHRIRSLQFVFYSYIYLNCFLYILLAILLEYSMVHHWSSNFDGYAKLPVFVRITIYLLFISLQYVIKQKSFQKNYGLYLNNMIRILNQTREE